MNGVKSPTSGFARRLCSGLTLWVAIVFYFWSMAATSQAIRNLPGFRNNSLRKVDDSNSRAANIGFTVNFFGRSYSSLFVNDNGNVTFAGPLTAFVPFGLARTQMPIIAAFFADVDTTSSGSGVITYGSDIISGHRAFGVDYFRVGYYKAKSDRLNTFQLVLVERSDTGAGNFDIELNYGQIQWDMGIASHQVSAVAGFSNGTGRAGTLFELPGSMETGAFLEAGAKSLIRGNLDSEVPGRYVFQARNGVVSFLHITTPPELPAVDMGSPYSIPPLTAEGGTRPYTWTPVNWPTDLDLHLDPSSGVISGTPTRAGPFRLTVRLTDSVGTAPAVQTFAIDVRAVRRRILTPYLIGPAQADAGQTVKIIAALHETPAGPPISGRDLPEPIAMEVQVEGQTLHLRSDGQQGDEQPGDGRFSGDYVFFHSGVIPVILTARGPSSSQQGQGEVRVTGRFVARVKSVAIDLGTLTASSESCRSVDVRASQIGEVPFSLIPLKRPPPDHRFELRVDGRTLLPRRTPLIVAPDGQMEICLIAGTRAPSSVGSGQPWLLLKGGNTDGSGVELQLRWRVNGLTFWQRWWWLIGLILLGLIVLFVIYGFTSPQRFPSGLALTFVQEYADLDETPQPLAQWRGVRIGFYRDARAYLHPNFRVTGEARGAIAELIAARGGGVLISPGKGYSLCRELDDGEWEEIDERRNSVRRGVVYRSGDAGPFFRLATQV